MQTTSNIELLHTGAAETSRDPKPKKPFILPAVQFMFRILGNIAPGKAAEVAYYFFTRPRMRARHNVSDPLLESARVGEFLYGKILLKTYEWGAGEQTVLLVHGWESRGTALRSFVPGLVENGFKVVTFDAPAHGDSGGKWTNLPNYAGAIKAMINRVGGVYGVITHSFGGIAAVYAAGKLDSNIEFEKMVMLAVPLTVDAILDETIRTLKMPPKAGARFKMKIEKIAKSPVAQLAIPQIEVGGQIKETLMIHDEKDKVVPLEYAKQIARKWQTSRLLITKGLGHYRLMKHPIVIQKVTEFITN